VAGKWERTRGPKGRPGIYEQQNPKGGKRYKVAYRDSRGKGVSRTFSRLEDAKAHQDEMSGRRRTGDLPDASRARRTLSELWEHFSVVRETRGGKAIKPSTFASYESRWTRHIEPAFGGRRVGEVSRDEVKRFLVELQARTSLDTRRKVQQVMHKIFAVGLSDGWVRRNPCDGIGMPGAEVQRQPQALSDPQVAAIATEVPDRYRALVWILAETGMRIGEATALRLKNLNGSIRVLENSPEVGGKKITGTPKTEGSTRNVPMSPRLRPILSEHLNLYSNRFDPEAFVFTTELGNQVSQTNFRSRIFQPAAKRAGIVPVPTVHDLRHTAISLWLTRGLTPFEVAKMVGHTDLKMIERRYGHLYESELQQKMDRLAPASFRGDGL
jgi:integrase